MKIALTSMDTAWENKSVNKKKCRELIKRASESGARLILFPEMTLTGFTMDVQGCGETGDQCRHCPTVAFFLEQSEQYGIAVGFGYIHREGEKGTNHFVVVDRGGDPCGLHEDTSFFLWRRGPRLYSGRSTGAGRT